MIKKPEHQKEWELFTVDIQKIVSTDYFWPVKLEWLTGEQMEPFSLLFCALWIKKKKKSITMIKRTWGKWTKGNNIFSSPFLMLLDRNSRLSSITGQFHQLPTQFYLKICLIISSQNSANSILFELGWQRNHEWFSLGYCRWLILSFGLAEPIQVIFLSSTGFSFEN